MASLDYLYYERSLMHKTTEYINKNSISPKPIIYADMTYFAIRVRLLMSSIKFYAFRQVQTGEWGADIQRIYGQAPRQTLLMCWNLLFFLLL